MKAERKEGKEAIFWECSRGTLNVVTPFIARVAIISTESWREASLTQPPLLSSPLQMQMSLSSSTDPATAAVWLVS